MMRRRSHAARRAQKGRELKRIRLPGRMAPIQRGFACLRTNLSIAQQNISIRESYDTSSGTPAGVDFPDLELRSTFAVWERGRLERHPRLFNGRHPLWETILLLVLNFAGWSFLVVRTRVLLIASVAMFHHLECFNAQRLGGKNGSSSLEDSSRPRMLAHRLKVHNVRCVACLDVLKSTQAWP